jgi:hypothetical protein
MRSLTPEERRLAVRFAHVDLPPDVTDCEPWEWSEDSWRRLFTIREWQVAGVRITVSGEQTHRGDVTLWIYVGGEDQFSVSGHGPLLEALAQAGTLLGSLIR